MSSDFTYKLEYEKEQKAKHDSALSKYMYDVYVFRWLHKHQRDESPYTYDAEHLDWCQRCKDNYAEAVRDAQACWKHPEAYFEAKTKTEPSWCEGCDPERTQDLNESRRALNEQENDNGTKSSETGNKREETKDVCVWPGSSGKDDGGYPVSK